MKSQNSDFNTYIYIFSSNQQWAIRRPSVWSIDKYGRRQPFSESLDSESRGPELNLKTLPKNVCDKSQELRPGPVAWSDAHPPGIQTVAGSILRSGKTSFAEIGPYRWFK